MPFPSFKSKKPASLSPEITSQTRPLVYAQSTYAPSEVDSINTSTQRSPDIRPPTHKAISSDVFADVTYYKEQKAKQAAAAAEAGEVDSSVDDETQQTPAFERPTTPPQGSRSLPWESYRDLEADHPVFLYPDDVREKMYAKGIGELRYRPCDVIACMYIC